MKTPKGALQGADQLLIAGITKAFVNVGEELKAETRHKFLRNIGSEPGHGDTVRIEKSIDYAMRSSPGNPTKTPDTDIPEDAIPIPDTPLELNFGAGIGSALYIEEGAGPHTRHEESLDGEMFMDKMVKWAKKVGIDPESKVFFTIVRKVQLQGTSGLHFMPKLYEVEAVVDKEISKVTKGLQLTKKYGSIQIDLNLRVGK